MKYLIKVKYVGTDFCGYQVQPNKRTVQSTLQDAIEKIFSYRYDLKGCSRTDSGVHANAFYATFDIENSKYIVPDKLCFALNSALPSDISVTAANIVSDNFHVRHDVICKEYLYRIYDGVHPDPFEYERAYFIKQRISDEQLCLMKTAAVNFIGKHDFKAFCASGSDVVDTVREIKYIELYRRGDIVEIHICGDGFLYNMVRIICGTLIDVAKGKCAPNDISKIIDCREREKAGQTLPACGLYLNRVEFKT